MGGNDVTIWQTPGFYYQKHWCYGI
jgi:hypothetical protein